MVIHKPKINPDDFIGKRFGRLVVLEVYRDRFLFAKCICDCGTMKEKVGVSGLKSGGIVSCGCYRKEVFVNKSHGMAGTPTYRVWKGILSRCYNTHRKVYYRYGGRGITVCERWRHSFENFYADMGIMPEGMELDRIDNNGNYEPKNCRWTTPKEQARNRRSNLYLTYNEKRMSLAEFAEITGIKYERLQRGIKKGIKPEDLVKRYTPQDQTTLI